MKNEQSKTPENLTPANSWDEEWRMNNCFIVRYNTLDNERITIALPDICQTRDGIWFTELDGNTRSFYSLPYTLESISLEDAKMLWDKYDFGPHNQVEEFEASMTEIEEDDY